jgi:hypothetical protein
MCCGGSCDHIPSGVHEQVCVPVHLLLILLLLLLLLLTAFSCRQLCAGWPRLPGMPATPPSLGEACAQHTGRKGHRVLRRGGGGECWQ